MTLQKRHFHTYFLTFLVWVFLTAVFFQIKERTFIYKQSGSGEVVSNNPKALLNDVRILEALSILQQEFIGFDTTTKNDLVYGIIRGMTDGLSDKHTQFMTTQELRDFDEELGQNFQGIGANIGQGVGGILVDGVLPNSPAEKSGLKRWDLLLSVNGSSLAETTVKEAVSLIRWPKNTIALIEYIPLGATTPKKVSIIRDALSVPLISSRTLTGSVGYIALTSFGEKSAENIEKSVQALVASGAVGIILDLRGNGGGYLQTAIDLISLFVPAGRTVVSIKWKTPDLSSSEISTGCSQWCDIPLVVLVDRVSASASEIVAGGFQDLERALVIGEKTYGKGSVQVLYNLSDGSAVKVTVSRWFTPKGRWIDGIGIEPTVSVPFTDEDIKNKYDRQLEIARELVLERASPLSENLQEIIAGFSGATLQVLTPVLK